MKQSFRAGLVVLALCGAPACFQHSYTSGTGGNTNGKAQYSKWHSHWAFWGTYGEENVDVKSVCPSGNATIKDEVSFVNGIIGALVGIVYYPTTVEVYCDTGKSAYLTVTPDQLRAIGLHPSTAPFVRDISEEKARVLADAVRTYEGGRAVAGDRRNAVQY